MTLYDPERKWVARAICRPDDYELFFADGGVPTHKPGRPTVEKWTEAKDICSMCPVLEQCRRDTLGEEYGVFGGLDQYERAIIRKNMTRTMDKWDDERRMAWAAEVFRLREAGISWRDMQTLTGLPPSASQKLMRIWEDHIASRGEAEIVDLPLPEPSAPRAQFPIVPGRRHMWVRHNGGISDGWYMAETEDAKWFYVTVFAGRGQARKWVPARDVWIYNPQPKIISEYLGRPDDDSRNPAA